MKKLIITGTLALAMLLAVATLAIASETGYMGAPHGRALYAGPGPAAGPATGPSDTAGPVGPGTQSPGVRHAGMTTELIAQMRAHVEERRAAHEAAQAAMTPGSGPYMDPASGMGPYMEPGTGMNGEPYMTPGSGPYMEPGSGPGGGPYMEPGSGPYMDPGTGMQGGGPQGTGGYGPMGGGTPGAGPGSMM